MGILTRRGIALAMALTLVSFRGGVLEAQQASSPDLIAAFLLNFVKFTTWPEGTPPAGASIVVCVLDDDRVADALTKIAFGQSASGHEHGRGPGRSHPIEVRRVSLQSVSADCQLVYGGNLAGGRARPLLQATSGLPILTVAASSDFAEQGGVANFFVDEGRLRFTVNTGAADRARLRISSKMLNLARIVKHVGPA